MEAFLIRRNTPTVPKSVERSLVHGTGEALPLPDKPSIAVLPFANLSADPEQEYFSDGVADDIIAELSRSRSLFVIARNSSFTYRGRSVDVRQVARELGVRYVLEGSVRRNGAQVRVVAQLIEAETGIIFGQSATIVLWNIYSRCKTRLPRLLHTRLCRQYRTQRAKGDP